MPGDCLIFLETDSLRSTIFLFQSMEFCPPVLSLDKGGLSWGTNEFFPRITDGRSPLPEDFMSIFLGSLAPPPGTLNSFPFNAQLGRDE